MKAGDLIRAARCQLLRLRIAQKESDIRLLHDQRHNDAQALIIIQGELVHLRQKLRTEETHAC
jgi:hypothetical protein